MYTIIPTHVAGRASLSQLFARQHVSRADAIVFEDEDDDL